MNKITKNILLKSFLLLIWILTTNYILSSCSKDDNLLTQEELVKASNDYKKTLEFIATSENLITKLTEKLESSDEDNKLIIQAQIDSETEKLEQLSKQRLELEKQLGIKTT